MDNPSNNSFEYNNNEEEAFYGVGSFLWEVVKVFFWALVIIVPIRVFLFQPFLYHYQADKIG